MLTVEGLSGGYGPNKVLDGLNLTAIAGQVTCIMGRNGAGKTTLMRGIMGQLERSAGTIFLDGKAIHALPAHEVPRHGIGYVPQGRRLFGPLSVAENIEIGLMTRKRGQAIREQVLDLFPRLRERLDQAAHTLSGGEQQMLALARALCLEPKLLLLDEPTEGLQPSIIRLVCDTLRQLKQTGMAIVLVEQRIDTVLEVADTIAFMTRGTVAETVAAKDLGPSASQFQAYVGV